MAERRRAVRYPLSWPVNFDLGRGTTADISTLGLFIRADRQPSTGADIAFSLDLPDSDDNCCRLICTGTVVRTEQCNTGCGFAVRLDRMLFDNGS